MDADDSSRMVEVDRSRLITAYGEWQRRRERADEYSSKHSDKLFVDEIRRVLELSRNGVPTRLGIPASRSTWSTWRKQTDKPLTKLRLDVCRAVLSLTGEDVTVNGFLMYSPVNPTDLVEIGEVEATPNQEASTSSAKGKFDLRVATLVFRMTSSVEVNLGHTVKNPTPHQKSVRIGSARYVLKEATIFAENYRYLEDVTKHLPSGSNSKLGKSTEVELIVESEQFARWRAQPPYPREALQARLEELKLCSAGFKPDEEMMVGVNVAKEEIQPIIELDRGEKLSNSSFQVTRTKLIEQVLRHRAMDRRETEKYVVSSVGVKRT